MSDMYRQSAHVDLTEAWQQLRRKRVSHALLDEQSGQTIPVLSHYSDVRAALQGSGQEGDDFVNRSTLLPLYLPCPEALTVLSELGAEPVTAAGDPPFHPQMRAALESVFPWKRSHVASYARVIEGIVTELLDSRIGETVELVDQFAAELPLRVILHLIGAPAGDGAQIRKWSDGQIHFIWGRPEPAEQVRLAHNLVAFWLYCLELAENNPPPHSITARLLAAGVTTNQAASFAFNLLVAGHETTRNLIVNMLFLLLVKPQRWQRLLDQPALVPIAVAETNRYMPPIIAWLRETARDVTIDDELLPAGTRILAHIAAANRDMPGGDDFDLITRPRRPLSFGGGPHYCIGAALAVQEAETALRVMLTRFRNLALTQNYTPRCEENIGFHAPSELWVTNG
ncbi:cytochrome P450 [Virgisporangium aurantiacum]|nr:cytochrome P450 [Virgisporangium aurantiacum]